MTEETSQTSTVAAAPPPKPVKKQRSFLAELPFLVAIAFVLALLIKHFLVQAFYIPSGSMENTLHIGDRVLVNKLPYRWHGPERGDIVVFNGLNSFDDGVQFTQPSNPISKALRKVSSTIGLGAPDEKDYIKRVIGVAGDRVMCCDAQGHVVVTTKDGTSHPLVEPYLYLSAPDGSKYFCEAGSDEKACPPGATGILVPKGRLWVMGDHRNDSADSRYHVSDANHGTVPVSKVVGRAFVVVYPFDHFGLLHTPKTFDSVLGPPVLGVLGALPLVALRRRRLHRRA